MVTWGTRRKGIITLVILAIGVLLVGWLGFTTFYRPPSCFDNRQNQGEAGVDCGGPCARLCPTEGLKPIVHWQRAFEVSSGMYNVVAYIENPNLTSGAENVPYEFKIYDDQSILIAERAGATNIPPHALVPVFEANVETGARAPARVEFAFNAEPQWIRSALAIPSLQTIPDAPKDIQTTPIIGVHITNESTVSVHHFNVVAIVYDASGNAQQASQTVADSLTPNGTVTVNFVWPTAFAFTPARVEILPILYPSVNY